MQMYTHTHIYGHIEMHLSLKCFFYFIFSGYEAHSERVKSHLLRLVCEKDRDRASGASPTLAQQPAGTSLGHELPLLTSTTQPLLTANSGNEPRLNQDLFNTMAMRPGRTWSFCFRTLFPVTSLRWQGMVKWSFWGAAYDPQLLVGSSPHPPQAHCRVSTVIFIFNKK